MRDQIIRLGTLFGLAIVGLILARHFLVPETFGEIGHYRAAAVDTIASQEVKYAGREACALCHYDVAATHEARRHRGVACEVCHGPAGAHVEDPIGVVPSVPRERALCQLCHGYDPARPTGFPQIEPVAHNPRQPCFGCHDPHAPEPPTTPEECAACHGQIARTKAVSHHAQLTCVECHEAPIEHKITPRLVVPTQPVSREFCGRCHAPDAAPPSEILQDVRRVDFATHGEHYVCWQCHYPHFPELQ